MPALVVTRPAATAANRRKVKIISEGGLSWTFPHAPAGFDSTGLAPRWEPVDRPGRAPLLEHVADELHAMSLSWMLGYPDLRSVEADLTQLRFIARSKTRVRFEYGPSEGGWWRVTDLGYQPLQRSRDQHIVCANVSLDVTRATEAVVNVGPVSGGAITTPAGPKPREVVTVAGDTFWTIAQKYLGNGNRWKEIADLNKIVDPRNRPRAGERLRLP